MHLKVRLPFAISLLAAVVALAAATAPARAAIYTVSSAGAITSLDHAVFLANGSPGRDTIRFDYSPTIQPYSPPRPILDAVFIDGYSHPGSHPNTLASGWDADIRVVIDGSSSLQDGLVIRADGCVIRGVRINQCRLAPYGGGGNSIAVDSVSGTVIEGNDLGFEFLHRNEDSGILVLDAPGTMVGGATPAARNRICGNTRDGVRIHGSGSAGTIVAGNIFYGDIGFPTFLGNGRHGVFAESTLAVTIGGLGAGAGNEIRSSSQAGVAVTGTSSGVSILGNSIVSNGGLGIDLGADGYTPNDPLDFDAGPNGLVNYPSVSKVVTSGGTTTVEGAVRGAALAGYRIEVFSSLAADSSSRGEGQTFFAATNVTTDGVGKATFIVAGPTPTGRFFTATATDAANNTSEFPCASSGFTVTNTDDDGPGSLRRAIVDTEAHPGRDTIAFCLNGNGVQTIAPLSQLPSITDELLVDGFTQPGAVPNALAQAINATLLVQLSGNLAGSASGLVLQPTLPVAIRGLVINRFANDAIRFQSSFKSTVRGCYIGTDPSGTLARPNGRGVAITSGNQDTIGGTAPGERNLISGNSGAGLSLGGQQLRVLGNLIGTDRTGLAALGNGAAGIATTSASLTWIGGASSGEPNLISGNAGAGISMDASDNNFVLGNLIGTDRTGLGALGNGGDGIATTGSSVLSIGGGSLGERNLISGNTGAGISMVTGGNSVVRGNLIGTDLTGAAPLPNGSDGVRVSGGAGHVIGALNPGDANLIAFNGGAGVAVLGASASNLIRGNSMFSNAGLGIDLGGDGVTPGDPGDGDSGPNALQNAPALVSAVTSGGTTVAGSLSSSPAATFSIDFYTSLAADPSGYGEGRTYLGSTTVSTGSGGDASFSYLVSPALPDGRVVTATAYDGLGNTSEFSNAVQAFTGFCVTNTSDAGAGSLRQAILDANAALGVQTIGFCIPGAGVHTIVPLTPLPAITDAVVIDGYTEAGSHPNSLAIGDDSIHLIELDGANGIPAPGLDLLGTGSTIRGLVIGRFDQSLGGIALRGAGGHVVEGCFIGTDPTGTTARGNSAAGIHLQSPNNRIGGTTPAARCVISGSAGSGTYGVFVHGSDNVIEGCYIGTNAAGTAAIPNSGRGVSFPGGADIGNLLGGTTANLRNVISGNDGAGVFLSLGNTVQGNFIGTNAAGTAAVGNGLQGVSGAGVVGGTAGTTPGGACSGACNLISGNGSSGVAAFGATVQGNFIGTNAAGTAAIPNGVAGVDVAGSYGQIGGSGPSARNLISGNAGSGVVIRPGPLGNVIEGNFIGMKTDGVSPLGNGSHGIHVQATSGNIVGRPGSGNLIAFNAGAGVAVDGSGNPVRGNSILSNGGLGIDLGTFSTPGVTPNDSLDGDSGGNDLQNFPILTSVTSNGINTHIQGRLNSSATAGFRLDFLSSAACDGSGYGEGELAVGTDSVSTDGGGSVVFDFTYPVVVAPGRSVTATATNLNGSTSEFSNCVTVVSTTTTVEPGDAPNVSGLALAFAPPAPNPVRGDGASFRVALPLEARVTLTIFDQQGRRVREVFRGTLPAGEGHERWDGRDEAGHAVPSGIYFARLEALGRSLRVRFAVVR